MSHYLILAGSCFPNCHPVGQTSADWNNGNSVLGMLFFVVLVGWGLSKLFGKKG